MTSAMSPLARGSIAAAWFCVASCKREPTYYETAEPLLAEYCVRCHRAGGVAPVPALDTFEHARAAAEKVKLAIQNRDMPPWGAENTGNCGKWRDALWMPDDDLLTLSKWTEHPELGDADRARPPKSRTPARFRSSGALDIGGDFVPGLGPEAYRCFVVSVPFAQDRTATAFRVVSTEPRSVEQLVLYALDSEAAENAATALE